MTSNLGSNLIQSSSNLGFIIGKHNTQELDYSRVKDRVLEAVKDPANGFKPEFLNRIDATVVFHPLSMEQIVSIVDIMLRDIQTRIIEHGLVLEVTNKAKRYLAEKGFDPKMGARPLRRLIQDEIEDIISDKLLRSEFSPGQTIELDIKNSSIHIKKSNKKIKKHTSEDLDDKEVIVS